MDLPERDRQDDDIPEMYRYGRMLVEAFEAVGNASNLGGLETSRWATPGAVKATPKSTPKRNPKGSKTKGTTTPPRKRDGSNPPPSPEAVAKLNDVGNFMAHARSRVGSEPAPDTEERETESPAAMEGGVKLSVDENKENEAPFASVAKSSPITPANTKPVNSEIITSTPLSTRRASTKIFTASLPQPTPPKLTPPKQNENMAEDREHQLYFSSWGSVAPRSTPRSEPRKVLLRGIPAWLNTPNKILSLIHGGRVESINIFPSGTTARVMFCDPAACRRFFDMYPNGIEITSGGNTGVIFVDMEKEPDIMSSRIREALEQFDATRVLKAVGADMNLSMTQLVNLAEGGGLRIEKIIDTYSPSPAGKPPVRTVVFRFTSIEHALKFRQTLARLDDWEQANIQWGPDPCELAKGLHWE